MKYSIEYTETGCWCGFKKTPVSSWSCLIQAHIQIFLGNNRNDSIQNPRFVRYGWQPTTDTNLVNGD